MTWDPELPGVVVLPSGRAVRARGLRRGPAAGPDPDLGVYLLGRPPPPTRWESWWVPWPDLRLPRDPGAAQRLLLEVWRIAAHARVEIACSGGVGRTGAALAVLAVADGVAPEQAIGWVRERHHRRAVETPGQRRWVRSLRAPAP